MPISRVGSDGDGDVGDSSGKGGDDSDNVLHGGAGRRGCGGSGSRDILSNDIVGHFVSAVSSRYSCTLDEWGKIPEQWDGCSGSDTSDGDA